MALASRSIVVALLATLCVAFAHAPAWAQERPWLGVTIGDAYSDALVSEGARVYLVVEASPASSAGVQMSDVIVALNGRPTPTTHALICAIESKRPGDFVDLTVVRGAQAHTVTARLGRWPDPERVPARIRDCGDAKIASAN